MLIQEAERLVEGRDGLALVDSVAFSRRELVGETLEPAALVVRHVELPGVRFDRIRVTEIEPPSFSTLSTVSAPVVPLIASANVFFSITSSALPSIHIVGCRYEGRVTLAGQASRE